MKKGKRILKLFLTFFKIGLFTFGGGYAMIAIIEDICVERKKWITHEDMMNVIVIAESTPGPISINCASFVGYRQAGFLGAVAATLGVVMPSFIIIYIISKFLDNFLEIKLVKGAFAGIKLAVGLLILDAGMKMMKKLPRTTLTWVILGTACAAMLAINIFSVRFSSLILLLAAAAAGLAVALFGRAREKREGDGK